MHPTLNIEHFPNDEDTEFHISDKREILSILQGIAVHGTRVALFYGDDQHFILTTLLAANKHGMWLEVGPFPLENKQLLLSDKITFVSESLRVKIQFVGRNVKNDLLDNNKAFYLELPDYLLRIQRREFFRTPIPATTHIKCIVPVQPENPHDPVVMRAVPIVDISGGGVGLLCEEHEATLVPNKIFPDCQISIPDVGVLTVTIEVRNGINFTFHNNVVRKRVGCRFIRLNNRTDNMLQRYIAHLQSESLVKS
jgi:c-di-GMP-binding flagellar brake protein YcgR